MKKTVLLICVSILFSFLLSNFNSANAKPVDNRTASLVAAHFWDTYRPSDAKPAATLAELTFAELPHLHVVAINGDGFVIVPVDDCIQPVLAYSYDDAFPTELNAELRYWLGGYNEQIAGAIKTDYQPTPDITAQWDALLNEPVPPTPLTVADIPALMTTRWNQSSPYNNYCPYDSVGNFRTVVGCTATAMAMIMKYWNYPAFGQGSHSYYHWDYGDISADFGATTYLWELMPDHLDYYSFSYEINPVALLSYHCGVAVDMNYGISSGAWVLADNSSMPCAHNAFVNYFKYSPDLVSLNRYSVSDSTWTAIIDTEMAHRRPILYCGYDTDNSGHAFVLDGADLEGRYHFNWGWDGWGNGFYTVNNLAPGRGGGAGESINGTYNIGQGIVYGIRPGMVETFDTMDYYDTICSDSQTHQFREYTFNVGDFDTTVRHLDTVFHYHLKVISRKRLHLSPNGAPGDIDVSHFCPATGIVLPECPFTKPNCIFTGWCRRANGEDSIYQPGDLVFVNTNVTFYAQWNDTTQHNDTVGITEIENPELGIVIYPNPACDELNIVLPEQTNQIVILDAIGRTVLRDEHLSVIDGTVKISLSALPAGLYIVQVRTSSDVYNQRIIKQ